MSRFPGIPGQPQPTPGVNYNSLTLEDKEKYVMIISRLLGLRADATIERITPTVAKKVDEFLDEAARCTKRIERVNKIFIALGRGNIMKAIKQTIEMWLDELERDQADYINIACYVILKRKYAQEVQYIFFMEGIGGIF